MARCFRRTNIKDKKFKAILRCYSEDILGRRKNKTLGGVVRSRLKEHTRKEVELYGKI